MTKLHCNAYASLQTARAGRKAHYGRPAKATGLLARRAQRPADPKARPARRRHRAASRPSFATITRDVEIVREANSFVMLMYLFRPARAVTVQGAPEGPLRQSLPAHRHGILRRDSAK